MLFDAATGAQKKSALAMTDSSVGTGPFPPGRAAKLLIGIGGRRHPLQELGEAEGKTSLTTSR